MANWNGLQLTNKGIALLAKVQAGTELVITKLKSGSGVLPQGTDVKNLTDLISPEQNLGIGAIEAMGDYCKISSTISNTDLAAGYYVRELGVFANDPDEGEILYLYANDGAPDYLPAGGGSTVISQEFSVMVAVRDTDKVSVTIDSGALATMGYVQLQIQAHNADADAHNDKIASQAEAEAQAEQNNTKFMTPLRVYQAIVAYFTKFLAAAVFTGIVKIANAGKPADSANDNSVPTTSWVRTCFTAMAKQVMDILEMQIKAEATGYFLLGPYLGNLKILWGGTGTPSNYTANASYPISLISTWVALGIGVLITSDLNAKTVSSIFLASTPTSTQFRTELADSPSVRYLIIGK